MPVISLLTDFGNKDGFVGTMKGVIWGICPGVQIADITHEIPPQNVRAGALALMRAAPYFPAGTVHIAVVDPGVGTSRRPMAAQLGSQFYVGPDNGLFTPLITGARAAGEEIRCVALDNPAYWLQTISRTFHGRDVFAPAGAHLAAGVPLESLGTPFTDPVLLLLSIPEKTAFGFTAHIAGIDTFGNCATDLPWTEVAGRDLLIKVKDRVIRGLCPSYGHHSPGELIALIDSEDYLEVAVVNGSAAALLGAEVGDPVQVLFNESE